jgi:hypothetical protein
MIIITIWTNNRRHIIRVDDVADNQLYPLQWYGKRQLRLCCDDGDGDVYTYRIHTGCRCRCVGHQYTTHDVENGTTLFETADVIDV